MFQKVPPEPRRLIVTSVATNLRTLVGLATYLERRISQFRPIPTLDGASVGVATSDAVVFYPDDFPQRGSQRFLEDLLDSPTQPMIIIVTAHPERYEAQSRSSMTGDRVIVLQKPAWPWELYATIQATIPRLGRRRSAPQ